jgi:hypothetical protein
MKECTVPPNAVPVMNQEFRVDRRCQLFVDVPGARVRMRRGSDEDRVAVAVSVANTASEAANGVLDRLQLTTRQVKDTVRVRASDRVQDAGYWRWLRSHDATVYVEIDLPRDTDADVRAPGGAIDAEGLHGNVVIDASACPVRAAAVEGVLRISAKASAVEVNEFEGRTLDVEVMGASLALGGVRADDVVLRSFGGSIEARDVRGRLRISAHGSPVRLEAVDAPLHAEVQGAELTVDGVPASGADLRAFGGSIRASLARTLSADVVLLGDEVDLDRSLPFQGEREPRRVEGRLNDGGPDVLVRATRGRVECTETAAS